MTPLRKILLSSLLPFLLCRTSPATVCDKNDFQQTIHVTDSLLQLKCNSYGALHIDRITRNKNVLNFYFTSSISDFPLRPGYDKWLKSTLRKNLPAKYSTCSVGEVYCCRVPVNSLSVNKTGGNGTPSWSPYKKKRTTGVPLVVRNDEKPSKGLYGRHIALWNSHGLYFDNLSGEWKWQRPHCFGQVEDLFTYNFVVDMLSVMLENAGANVLIPRERDLNDKELIIDNDPSFDSVSNGIYPRIHGRVETKGKWTSCSGGFRDYRANYPDSCANPFGEGTYLSCRTTTDKKYERSVTWYGNVPCRGVMSVYVSYKCLPESISRAVYIIHALGGDRTVSINQKMGSDTWVYVGDYEFDKGEQALVSLSNLSQQQGVITADAVKIGGGMGNVSRTGAAGLPASTSMCPRAFEGARYFLRWSGMPRSVWYQNDGKSDYRDDLMCRGEWVKYLSGGSVVNPRGKGLKIPVDLSVAFHTDAGQKADNAIVGTLSIYTLMADGKKTFADGASRSTCRELSDFMQTQVVDDIRAEWDPEWRRRQLWNRSYSESRTTGVPAVLLELLSHQNFEDMRYGTDPLFRFTVARSCYKAILKYLAMHYGRPYVVQPLPVHCFSAILDGDNAVLKWQDTSDKREITAKAASYILYTRIDGGGWNTGEKVNSNKVVKTIRPGHIYSFKVVAVNDGGMSFPSEILSVGIPWGKNVKKALVVNAFTRVSAPSGYCNVAGYGDFEAGLDSGVPYIRDVNSAGNSFDYPYVHGRALMKAGYSFESCSSEALMEIETSEIYPANVRYDILDVIFGKQCRVITGKRSPARYGCLTPAMCKAISAFIERGCNIIVSGSYIASDACHNIFGRMDTETDWPDRDAMTFASSRLGYSLHRAYACKSGSVTVSGALDSLDSGDIVYYNRPNADNYCVESPDAIIPSGKNGMIVLRYGDTHMPAAVFSDFGSYRCASFGFPLETICDEDQLNALFLATLNFLEAV